MGTKIYIAFAKGCPLKQKERSPEGRKTHSRMNTAGGIGTHYLPSDGIQLGSGHQYIQRRFY